MPLAILLPLGLVAGFVAGFLGMGGGIVIVPTPFWLAPLLKPPAATA